MSYIISHLVLCTPTIPGAHQHYEYYNHKVLPLFYHAVACRMPSSPQWFAPRRPSPGPNRPDTVVGTRLNACEPSWVGASYLAKYMY